MSKIHGDFTENFIMFFSNTGKTKNAQEFEFDKFMEIIFRKLYTCFYLKFPKSNFRCLFFNMNLHQGSSVNRVLFEKI